MPARSGGLVDVVVLSADVELYDAIRDAVGERNPVWRASSAEESVDLLITGRCGVLLLDLVSVTSQPDKLVQQIVEQFPDVVVCVAGLREDEPVLASLISEGLVYRFMHKPLSPRRAGMFLQAAIRHHRERRDSLPAQDPLLATVTQLPSRYEPMKWAFVCVGVALFVMLLSAVLGKHTPAPAESTVQATAGTTPVVATPTPQADPVLSRARAAFAAGRYESPLGRNALDLYKAVLLVQPDNPEAQVGLDKTLEHVLMGARIALDTGDTVEAQRLVDRALAADPGRSSAVQIARRIRTLNEPAPEAQAMATPAAIPVTATPSAPAAASTAPAAVANEVLPPELADIVAPATRIATQRLPGPVTKLPLVSEPRVREAAVTAPTPAVVRPDPLAARISNAEAIRASQAPRQPIYARKVEPLPIAGYVTSREPESRAAKTVPQPVAPLTSGSIQSADELERVAVTDPVYPLEALRNRTKGWVQLEFTITPSGSVGDIAVIDAEPKGIFNQAATDALSHWRYRPRIVNGQPVAQRSTVTMRFDVDG